MRMVNPVLSAEISAASVMDSRDMTVDGPADRAAFPSIHMTTAVQVAARVFGSTVGARIVAA
jgi:hypothetical protein